MSMDTTRDSDDASANGASLVPLRALLAPPQTKGHVSVARMASQWFIVAMSRELKKKPLARMLMGIPLVLFRDGEGKPGALLDRCPHRNVPLSLGRVAPESGQLECAYHGWRFDRGGACRFIPVAARRRGERRRGKRATPDVVSGARSRRLHLGLRNAGRDAGVGSVSLPAHRCARLSTTTRDEVFAESTSMHAAIENALRRSAHRVPSPKGTLSDRRAAASRSPPS